MTHKTGGFIAALILYATLTAQAQDNMILRNGSEIPAKGLEVTKLGAATLAYQSGLFSRYFITDAGNRLARREVRTLMQTQPQALAAFDRGQSLRRLTLLGKVGTVALVGTGLALALAEDGDGDGEAKASESDPADGDTSGGDLTDDQHGDGTAIGYALAGGGVVLGIVTAWLDHRATVQFRRAANGYNARPATSLRVGPSSRGLGVGVALRF